MSVEIQRAWLGISRAAASIVPTAKRFQDLICWQLAYELHLALLELAKRPSVVRDFRFRDQLRDTAASAARNIAEGHGRGTDKDFARFLDIARGSLTECQYHLCDAVARGYITTEERDRLLTLSRRASAAVAGLQRYLRQGSR